MAEITDFTDYAKPVDFKYNDGIYRIPAFGKNQIERLMQLSKKFSDEDDEEKGDEEKDDEVTKEAIEKSTNFFNAQDEYLCTAIMKKNASEQFVNVPDNEFVDWPVKLKNHLMSMITNQMSVVNEDNIEKKS